MPRLRGEHVQFPVRLQRFIAGAAHDVAAPGASLADDIAHLRVLQDLRTPQGVVDAVAASRAGIGPGWLRMAGDVARESPTTLQGVRNAGAVTGAMAFAGVRSIAAKFLHARPRPYDMGVGITSAIGTAARGSSYPSTHAAVSSAAVGVIERVGSPQLVERARTLAAATADSRQYLGVHFPSDVAAGEAMGTAAAGRVLRLLGVG